MKDPKMHIDKLYDDASNFAYKKHLNHKDDNGESYFHAHLENVVDILLMVTHDPYILAAAILHDTLEDTDTTYEELANEFGTRIANIVNAVTHEGQKDTIGYYFPRLDPTLVNHAAILIKFADRLSNLSRMEAWDDKRKEQYLRKSVFWKRSKDA